MLGCAGYADGLCGRRRRHPCPASVPHRAPQPQQQRASGNRLREPKTLFKCTSHLSALKKKRPCMVRTCSSDPSRPAANREGNGEHGEPVPASKQGYSGDPGSRAEGEQPLGTPRSPCAAQVVAGSQPTFLMCLAPGLGCSSASLFIPDSLFIPGLFLSHISSSRCLTSSSQPFLISVFWAGGITIYWQHLGNISCLISLNCMCRSRGNSWYRELHPQPLIMPLRRTNRHI